MNEFYCIEIEFINVNFNSYYIQSKTKISKSFHTHLYTNKDEIELKIFFDTKTYFGEKFMTWTSKIDWNKFGTFLKVELSKNQTNNRLQKIDLSDAKLLGSTNSTKYYENGNKYIIVKIDTIKFYWNPVEDEINTAEFYLDDKGFRVIEPFYSHFSPKNFGKNNSQFEIGRMKDSNKYYKLAKSSFRPEYNFVSKDDRNNRVATITKEPKIQFKYKNGITENETIFYGDVILMLASFYYHIKIEYVFRRIHLPESTITIKNIEQNNFLDTKGNLWGFGIFWEFNKFLESSWQKETIKNYTVLAKAISLFNQSHLVDSYSSFLIRYNIIEICDNQKQRNIKFKPALNKKETKAKLHKALITLLETIDKNEHEEFKKRWNNIQALLQNKPMKNQLTSFLESQNIDSKEFPLELDQLKKLRDNITHGSIDKVSKEQLKEANVMLYKISGIIILNLMGIKEWTINTEKS